MAASSLRQSARSAFSSISAASSEVTRTVLNLPHTYSEYVQDNPSSVSSVESSIRSLTYLLPGVRLHDSEIAAESVNTFVQLLSIYHDHLLKKRAAFIASSPALKRAHSTKTPQSKASLHAKYTTFWSNSSSLYTRIATCLKISEYVQLLCEMMARRRGGERGRWRIVVLIESFKAMCRLLLMRLTSARSLVSPVMPERADFAPPAPEEPVEEFPEHIPSDENEAFASQDAFRNTGVPTPPLSDSGKVPSVSARDPFPMPRTGTTLPTLPTSESVTSYLLSHVLTPDDVKPAYQLLRRLSSIQAQSAEVLYILRPLIYALMMQKIAREAGPGDGYISDLEREESKKRSVDMTWWLMRGAFYENVTRKYVRSVQTGVSKVPLLGPLVAGIVEDYDILWGEYHFSTSTL
ncbi:Peroxisomal membrane protein PEX16 [Cyphellophora attinorum]|uniref:Peroxisomal membrane protein PEX16 n=1 Tax=Cyphellophora attinorum TaxID=1664694 RepID=A0A0N1GZP6_9EURO|nr:Peroxisomal membrane protein PEX16 [Phialophora attinorum]KPI36626.1 Peroxisomal membrane protein PEX16 [Phialophora attinorum]